jgi:hypothetical protein
MSYRVIQWATGDLASKAVAGIVGHPDLELVGAWVHSAEKEGRDVGEICGIGPRGVLATRDKQSLYAMEADCVCYMAGRSWTRDPMTTVGELARILRSGKNVVNATWPSLVYPQALGNGIYDTLLEACMEGGTTLYTAGIDPGYGRLRHGGRQCHSPGLRGQAGDPDDPRPAALPVEEHRGLVSCPAITLAPSGSGSRIRQGLRLAVQRRTDTLHGRTGCEAFSDEHGRAIASRSRPARSTCRRVSSS